jgi:hypothetical protein
MAKVGTQGTTVKGVKGTSAGSQPWSGHHREVMASAWVGPGMGQLIGVTAEGWWLWSDKSAAIFLRGDKCVIHSLFSPQDHLCMVKNHNLQEVTLFVQNTADLKE